MLITFFSQFCYLFFNEYICPLNLSFFKAAGDGGRDGRFGDSDSDDYFMEGLLSIPGAHSLQPSWRESLSD